MNRIKTLVTISFAIYDFDISLLNHKQLSMLKMLTQEINDVRSKLKIKSERIFCIKFKSTEISFNFYINRDSSYNHINI